MRAILTLLLVLSLAGCATTTVPHRHHADIAAPAAGTVAYLPSESFVWPVRGDLLAPFGAKIDYVKNKGIDIRTDLGEDVRAAKAGIVVFRDEHMKGFGRTVILDHGGNYQTVYAYNSEILVNVGDAVERNDVIAKTGKTGRAKSPSLHFEIRKDGKPQDPLRYLRD